MHIFKNIWRHLQSRYVLLVTWCVTLGVFWGVTWLYAINWSDIFQHLIAHHTHQRYTYLGVIVLYCLRPLFRVPVAWLSVVVGTLYDFGLGLLLAMIGENISAVIGYMLSKYFRFRIPSSYQQYFRILNKKQSLLAVFLSRISPVPDDINNYGRAMMNIGFLPYIGGTIAGNLVFTSINVWMGSSLVGYSVWDIVHNPMLLLTNYQLAMSLGVYIAIVILASIAIRYLMLARHK